jgi:hypothetical protein
MVDMPKLTDEQLMELGTSEESCTMLRDISETIEGVACLVNEDERAGSFRGSGSLFCLLVGLAYSIDCAVAAIDVQSDATYTLNQRKIERASSKVSARGKV